MKYISIFTLLFCLTITVKAQSNYKSGYIITNSNDTIRGLIDFRTDKMNSSYCRFKLSKDANEKIYYPDDIFGYMFINEVKYYVSRTITIDNKTEKVFLEYLVQGLKDLYYYPLNNGYYFIEDKDGKMISFTKKSDEIVDNKYIEDKKYIGALIYTFQDCESILKNIDKTEFDRGDMIRLTKKYHTQMCSPGEECIVFENDYKKKFIEIGGALYGGLQLVDYVFKNTDLTIFNSAKSLSPVIGGQFSVTSPRMMKSLSFQIDVSLAEIKGITDRSGLDFDMLPYRYKRYKFNSLISTGIMGLKYTYMKGKWQPFIEAGICYSLLFHSSSSFYCEAITFDHITHETTDNYQPVPPNMYGLNCGIGLTRQLKNKHSIFGQIVYNKLINYEADINRIQIKLGYNL